MLFNSVAQEIHLGKSSPIYNFKTRLVGEIFSTMKAIEPLYIYKLLLSKMLKSTRHNNTERSQYCLKLFKREFICYSLKLWQ